MQELSWPAPRSVPKVMPSTFSSAQLSSGQTFREEGSLRFLPGFAFTGFFLSRQVVNGQPFSAVTLSSAVTVRDRRKGSRVVCQDQVRLPCASAFFLRSLSWGL